MASILKEGLDYHDMIGQLNPTVTVDEYAAKMGEDSNIVTLTFVVSSKLAADDLVNWLELGYDYVLDASVSDGELEPGKWLVFVEMKRRSNIPQKIVQLLEDLQTLTDLSLEDWKVKVNDETYKAEADVLKNHIILSPSDYKKQESSEEELNDELNEMRTIAGLKTKNQYSVDDEIKKYISNAGL